MAYELGADDQYAVGTMAVTCDASLVPRDEVILIGPDLSEISQNSCYARISLVRVAENSLGDGNALYNAIRKIEYVKYHINPEGYMTRISAKNFREPVRVSKEAINKGISFSHVGRMFLDSYHENKNIEAVRLIFITDPNIDYKLIAARAKQLADITDTIDHIFKNVTMDCKSCSLQNICDEVEGLRELHFSAKPLVNREEV